MFSVKFQPARPMLSSDLGRALRIGKAISPNRKTNQSDERGTKRKGKDGEETQHSLLLPDSLFYLYQPSLPSNTLLSISSLFSTTLGNLNRPPKLPKTPEYSLLISSTLHYYVKLSTTPCDLQCSPVSSDQLLLISTTSYDLPTLHHTRKNSLSTSS